MENIQEITAFSVIAAGFVLGLRHAIEADHLAAVATIVTEKKSIVSASLVGGLWGVGHTIALIGVGALVIFLKLQISDAVGARLEAAVGVMLVLLGLNAFRKLMTAEKVHAHVHGHGEREHIHFHKHDAGRETSHHRFSPRSVVVGMVHGLAGSAALMLLVVPTINSPVLAMAYILVFGVGSVGGMMVMSLLISLPLHFTAARFSLINQGIRVSAGLFSLGLGALIIYENLV